MSIIKKLYIYTCFLIVIMMIISCKKKVANEGKIIKPGVAVKVTPMVIGNIAQEVTLMASSIYLKRNLLTAPVPSFITDVRIKLGDKVSQGDLLYVLETKERKAFGPNYSGPDSSLKNFGRILVKAPSGGIISTLDRQQIGDYVLEGNPLCTIAESRNLAFQINVPYEYSHLLKKGSYCIIVLPDKNELKARIETPLTNMNVLAQTQTFLARPTETIFLPENLIASVKLTTQEKKNTTLLPNACLLSDEVMKSFWVMKLVNDSTAIKVVVDTGIKNDQYTEIVSPNFNVRERFLSEGNYGLADTAKVKVVQ
jgi:hypothetical protein